MLDSKWRQQVYSDRYMRPFSEITCDTNKRTLVCVRGGMGLGKTHQTRALLQRILAQRKDAKILLIGPRVAFDLVLREVCSDLDADFTYYQDTATDSEQESLAQYSRLIVQYESVYRLGSTPPKYDLLIIDEIESVLECVTAGFQERLRVGANAQTFSRVLSLTQNLLALDADLQINTMNLLCTLMGPAARHYHYNTYARIKRRVYNLSCPVERFWAAATDDALQSLLPRLQYITAAASSPRDSAEHQRFQAIIDEVFHDGPDVSVDETLFQKTVLLSGSKAAALAYVRLLEDHLQKHISGSREYDLLSNDEWCELFSRYLIRFYHSDSDDRHLRADLGLPSQRWASAGLVVFTSRVTVGADYTRQDVSRIWVYAWPGATSPRELWQMSGRFRSESVLDVHLYVERPFRPTGQYSECAEQLYQQTQEFARALEPQTGCSSETRENDGNSWIFALALHNRANRNRSLNDYSAELRKLSSEKGWEWIEGNDTIPNLTITQDEDTIRASLKRSRQLHEQESYLHLRQLSRPSSLERHVLEARRLSGRASKQQKLLLAKESLLSSFSAPLPSNQVLCRLISCRYLVERVRICAAIQSPQLETLTATSQLSAIVETCMQVLYPNEQESDFDADESRQELPITTLLLTTNTHTYQLAICLWLLFTLGISPRSIRAYPTRETERADVRVYLETFLSLPQKTIRLIATICREELPEMTDVNPRKNAHKLLMLINRLFETTMGARFEPRFGPSNIPCVLSWLPIGEPKENALTLGSRWKLQQQHKSRF